ncbi:hypothetical protein [Streptomyces lincolnensis]|uniref:hypothetical protein n=1 Tax=Streptomyces lincolnensis TaxID=1915 RepID=UPI0037D27ECF
MPRSPLLPRVQELFALQSALGMRHAADALFPVDRVRFRILDGLHIPSRTSRWSRVDHAALARARDGWRDRAASAAPAVEALFGRYARIIDSHPLALRRLVLYELLRLLASTPHTPTADDVTALGVDVWEAEALAHAAAREPRLSADSRAAAEELVDAWHARRIRRALDCAARLGEPGRDTGLARFVLQIANRDRGIDALLARAAELEDTGDRAGAAALYLEAARDSVDDSTAVEGLLRTATDPVRVVTAVPVPDGLRLRWPGAGPCRVLRRRGGTGPWTLLADRVPGPAFTDTDVTPGETVQYAVLVAYGQDSRGGGADGLRLVLAGPPVRHAPEVEDVRVQDARDRVTVTWRTPPAAIAVLIERLTAHGGSCRVPADENRFADTPVAPGEHRYLIRCCYRLHDGRETLSDGVAARVTVHRWPTPVTPLLVTSGPRPGRIAVGALAGWDGADGSEVRLYDRPLPVPRRESGCDLPARELPAPLDWETTPLPHGVELLPPRDGIRFRLTAVSVLGDRATTGASVDVEFAAPVRNFRVRRVEAELARVTFEWPERAERVDLRWIQAGSESRRVITRSAHRRSALEFALHTAAAQFRIQPVPPAADVVIAAGPTDFHLPPDLAVTYDVRRPTWWSGARRRVTVRAEYAPADLPDVLLPDLVLVARAADGPPGATPPRPRYPGDGVPLLRLFGAELGAGHTVQRDVEVTVRDAWPPYTLRAFLLGAGAEFVRLTEPPPERLVVR